MSYAWAETAGRAGLPTTEEILVNGHTFEVSENLAAVLRSFRGSHPGVLVWADAICHNQDDKAEINVQLGRMTDIYQRCSVLHIWLGKEATSVFEGAMNIQWTSTIRATT